jgi:hypothetical protein
MSLLDHLVGAGKQVLRDVRGRWHADFENRLASRLRGRGVREPAFKPLQAIRMTCQGFKPDPGNLAVRHYRGASRNVRHGETVNPPAIERAGSETPHLQQGALDLYPNRCRILPANSQTAPPSAYQVPPMQPIGAKPSPLIVGWAGRQEGARFLDTVCL